MSDKRVVWRDLKGDYHVMSEAEKEKWLRPRPMDWTKVRPCPTCGALGYRPDETTTAPQSAGRERAARDADRRAGKTSKRGYNEVDPSLTTLAD